jgi:peptide deformylase
MLKITTHPDPILSKKCEDVTVFDDELKKLVNEMAELMYASNGCGLAANQVGVAKNIIIFDATSVWPHSFQGLVVMINPKIRGASDDCPISEEGCLSLPGVYVHIKRAANINVEFCDIDGKLHHNAFGGGQARVIQHECDHLNGRTMLDNVSKLERKMALKKLTSQK